MKRIILAGGSGFLGRALSRYFQDENYEVIVLSRTPREKEDIVWDAKTLGPWQDRLEGAEAVINLTGKSVNCRYNARNRAEILNSRVNSTNIVGQAIGKCAQPPKVWINASTATVYKHNFGPAYGENGAIDSDPAAKDPFSLEVARAWEKALNEAHTPKTRKVALRLAMVLGLDANSVFPTLRRLTRLGLGGKMGNGKQYVSWIHQHDFCRAVHWIITHPELSGPINVTSPNPVTNAQMMQTLREILHIPFGLPAPEPLLEIGAFFLRTETELIIKSRRVIPAALSKSGFQCEFPEMSAAFKNLNDTERR